MEMPDRNGASADDLTTQQNMDAFLSGCAAHADGALSPPVLLDTEPRSRIAGIAAIV
jgi:hypothetical protein